MNQQITGNADGTTTITWQVSGASAATRYNYVVETNDGHLFSAIPLDEATGALRQAYIDAATTGTSVTLNIPYSNIKAYGIQTIGANKKGGAYPTLVDPSVSTGIAGIESETDAPTEYFNLQGQRVAHPTTGVYIKRKGSQVTKCYIR